jgi:hypothetical protein
LAGLCGRRVESDLVDGTNAKYDLGKSGAMRDPGGENTSCVKEDGSTYSDRLSGCVVNVAVLG